MYNKFWSAVDSLVQSTEIIIDRPKGSLHPRHPSVTYPLDYGYLAGTSSGDQSGIDVWVGSLLQQDVSAMICTVDLDKSDAEVKILIGCTKSEVQKILDFHNQGAQSAILIQRYNPKSTE